jgi:hypothetical protein
LLIHNSDGPTKEVGANAGAGIVFYFGEPGLHDRRYHAAADERCSHIIAGSQSKELQNTQQNSIFIHAGIHCGTEEDIVIVPGCCQAIVPGWQSTASRQIGDVNAHPLQQHKS